MAIKKEIDINVNTKGAEDSVNNLSSGLSGVAAQADRLTGGLVSGFRNGVKGIKTAITGMRSLKVAIASTGIGLLVVAIGSLVAFFTKTQRGADLLSKATKGLGAVVDVLTDRLSSLGEILVSVFSDPQKAIKDFGKLVKDNIQNRIMGLVELLPALGKAISLALKGKFKEAGQTAVDAAAKVTLGVENLSDKVAGAAESVKGLAKEISEEAKAASELEAAQQALEDREIALINVNAKRRASIEKLRLEAEDETKTNEERADALREAAKLQNDIADDEIAIAEERARIIKERVALGESSRDDIREQAEAEARVIELEAERDRRLKSLITRLNAFTDAQDGASESLGNYEEKMTKVASKEIQFAADTSDITLALHKNLRQSMLMVDQQYANQADQIRKDSIKKTREQKMMELQIIAGTLGSLANLAGENAHAGKALSAAEAVINTYTGATKALSQGGIFGAIAAAGVVASGLASVRQIYATPIPATSGGSTGGGSVPRPQISTASISPRFALDTAASDLGNQITQSLQGQPVRAYVVNQDIQNANKLDRKIKETATLE